MICKYCYKFNLLTIFAGLSDRLSDDGGGGGGGGGVGGGGGGGGGGLGGGCGLEGSGNISMFSTFLLLLHKGRTTTTPTTINNPTTDAIPMATKTTSVMISKRNNIKT
ncbi:hypothetical protein DPMN_023092 [Dreissena polymorpha]|uniref:Uncharacterized protein n=1 Tax=Dreissena polymorpha TaxID=45954 RepID=A0A9D4LLG8_DREPO|nr:hypothetical protein DPMN_023092 [Dreissena polymorpha]